MASMHRSPGPKLRRRAPIQDTLQETTAVQRLVDYFVVITPTPRWTDSERSAGAREVGHTPSLQESRQESIDSGNQGTEGNIHMPTARNDHTFQPNITARYPETDYTDNPLNPMITQFCYPSGDNVVPYQTYHLPQIHYFVLTNERGRKIYGTCLTVFEEYEPEGPWKSRAMTVEEEDGIELRVDDRGNNLYLPKKLCLLSTWPYLTAFREYLAQLYRLATATNIMSAPIERYIVNLCCEIPAPPPGAYEVQVNILESTIRFWAPPAKLPIAYVALPYKILFECLDVENTLSVWTAMIVERKILLVSSHYSILTVCAEVLSSLLFPLRWSHLYVPLLPRMFAPMLDAPVPFLCGVVRDSWLYTQQYVSDDAIIVDLDNNSVEFREAFPPVPQPPSKKINKLRQSLLDLIGNDFWKAHGAEEEYETVKHKQTRRGTTEKLRQSTSGSSLWNEKRASLDNAYSLAFTPGSPEDLLNDTMTETEQAKWANVQRAFHQFFVGTLKHYRRFLKINDDSHPSFDHSGFLNQQKSSNYAFLSEMCMSQQFDDFLTRRLYSPGEPDLVFFDQTIDAKKNRSKLKLRKVDTTFLSNANAHKQLTKFPAVPPNDSQLPKREYLYQKWPETFKADQFSEPRPIPRMITAEFDRQAGLVAKLRTNVGSQKWDAEADNGTLDFFGGNYSDSAEVGTFTLFFFTYGALVGRDLQRFILDRKSRIPASASDRVDGCREGVEPTTQSNMPEALSLDREKSSTDALVSDLTFGVCDSCPPARLQSTLLNMGQRGVENLSILFSEDPMEQEVQETMSVVREQSLSQRQTLQNNLPNENSTAFEEAQEMASAQLDLAFQTLATSSLRGIAADSDAYSSLMEACGRCGDTQRALKLIELMRSDGFAADAEILSYFVTAFAYGKSDLSLDSKRQLQLRLGKMQSTTTYDSDAYSRFLKGKADSWKDGEALEIALQQSCSESVDESDSQHSGSNCEESSPIMDWLSRYRHLQPKKKKKKKQRTRTGESCMLVTDMIARQFDLGETLLDLIYPGLKVETDSDSCPHCSFVLSESDVVEGWSAAAFNDLKTKCPQCYYRFVAQFSVSTSARNFEGSQGIGTPLYCEFLSPWVLRKELQQIVKGSVGIDGMLTREWRNSTDLSATLFWNLILLFRRYKLPFAFLLQGSFDNLVVLPRRPDEMA